MQLTIHCVGMSGQVGF